MDWSHAGIIVNGVDLASGAAGAFTMSDTNEDYRVRGVHTLAHNRSTNGSYRFDRFVLEARVFNDGVGFRFVVPGQGARTPDEARSIFTEGWSLGKLPLKRVKASKPSGKTRRPPMVRST